MTEAINKLSAREKVAVWALLYLIRYFTPNDKMADDMKEMMKNMQHQVHCNL